MDWREIMTHKQHLPFHSNLAYPSSFSNNYSNICELSFSSASKRMRRKAGKSWRKIPLIVEYAIIKKTPPLSCLLAFYLNLWQIEIAPLNMFSLSKCVVVVASSTSKMKTIKRWRWTFANWNRLCYPYNLMITCKHTHTLIYIQASQLSWWIELYQEV